VLALAALACSVPFGPFAGGHLPGPVTAGPIQDWSFATMSTLQLETRPDDPRSLNLHFVEEGPRLWTATILGDASEWARDVLADGRVRVRVGDRIYERQAVRVSDAAEIQRVADLYREKYTVVFDVAARDTTLVFRLDPR